MATLLPANFLVSCSRSSWGPAALYSVSHLRILLNPTPFLFCCLNSFAVHCFYSHSKDLTNPCEAVVQNSWKMLSKLPECLRVSSVGRQPACSVGRARKQPLGSLGHLWWVGLKSIHHRNHQTWREAEGSQEY